MNWFWCNIVDSLHTRTITNYCSFCRLFFVVVILLLNHTVSIFLLFVVVLNELTLSSSLFGSGRSFFFPLFLFFGEEMRENEREAVSQKRAPANSSSFGGISVSTLSPPYFKRGSRNFVFLVERALCLQ